VLIKFPYICALLLVLLGLSVQSETRAQSLGINPASVDANVKRGASYQKDFTISNSTSIRVHLRCSVGDFWYGANNERIDGPAGTLPRSASTWVQFSPSEVVIEPNTSATVRALITVPSDAGGGYYTTPIFEAEAAAPQSGMAAAAKAGAASITVRFKGLILLTTDDATEYNVEIKSGHISAPTASAPLSFELDLRNRSTAHVRIRGDFAIIDETGKLAGRGKIDEKRYLPGQQDWLKANWGGELAHGHYIVVITLTYERAGMEAATLVYELPLDVR
jgi:hypothetical protein